MGEAVGGSHLYPIVPIMNFFSMVLTLLLLPGFWKTRIVALVSVVGWIFIGNLAFFLSMIHWRGHTNDALVWASILAVLGSTWYCGFFMSIACFAHFTWQRLQPLSVRHLYDTRRRDNMIHLFFTLILPVLWAPLYLLSCDHRYMLIEDFGPLAAIRRDWPGFVVSLPPTLSYATVGIFNVLSLGRYWHAKQENVESDSLKHHPSVRTRKLLLMAVVNTLFAVYGIYSQAVFWWSFGWWVPPKSLAENITSLQLVLTVTRPDLDTSFEVIARGRIVTAISIPLLGFYIFAWFGCGTEARKAYGDGLLKFGRLIGVAGTLACSWSATALRKAKPWQDLVHPLPIILPNPLQFRPYIAALPREHAPQLPAAPTMHPSNPVGNVIDSKRRAPPRDPVRRLSSHKPPVVPLDPTNTAAHTVASVPDPPVRRLSSHKPPFVPLDPTNTVVYTVASAPNPPTRRLSYHKPAFRPLDPENPILNTRLQEEVAPRPQARRLSYHKPPLRPFVPANVNARSTTPDALVTSIPLVDVQRRPKSSGATGLPVESTVDALPPAFPTSSTSMAPPPPPSYQHPATPAPPYQDPYPFFNHAA